MFGGTKFLKIYSFLWLYLYTLSAWGTAHFNFASGELRLPVVAVQTPAGEQIGHYAVLLELSANLQYFSIKKALPTQALPAPSPADATLLLNSDNLSASRLQIPQVEAINPAGVVQNYYEVQFAFDAEHIQFLIADVSQSQGTPHPFQRFYLGTESRLLLKRGSNKQYLLPVEVGNQVLNLLVDTGSNGLLVFEDALANQTTSTLRRSNQRIQLTGEQVAKGFASTQRSGVVATAPVRIGAFYNPAMRIMLIQEPTSSTDPSLSLKNADGIIGLRRVEGVTRKRGELDIPLESLKPSIQSYELNFPADGQASLSLGSRPHFAGVDSQYVFQAKSFLISNGLDLDKAIHSDLQIPFNISTPAGKAQADKLTDLDVLLDTGAVNKLVLDVSIAEKIGYDADNKKWTLSPDSVVDLSLIGLDGNIQLEPALTIADIGVASYKDLGVSFEAVLGIQHWQQYVLAYHHERNAEGVADGTVSLLHRSHLAEKTADNNSSHFEALAGLNSIADEQHPSADASGNRIAFQSNRSSSVGGWDIFVWDKAQKRLLDLSKLNSAADDSKPCLSADGNLLVFQSLREGNSDVFLYDIAEQAYLPTPKLNSLEDDLNPCLSPDGEQIVFNSARSDGAGGQDLYVYQRSTESFTTLPGLNENGDESQGRFSTDGAVLSFSFAGRSYFYSLESLSLLNLSDRSSINNKDDDARLVDGAASLSSRQIALHSNRNQPQLGLYDRDILLFNLLTQAPTPTPGLNSKANDLDPVFSNGGQSLLFSSNRASSIGGHDIYLYHLEAQTETASADDAPIQTLATGLHTVPVTLAGQQLNLLLLTEFSGIALFEDKLASSIDASASTLDWLGLMQGRVGTASLDIYGRNLKDIAILLTDSQSFQAQFTLLAGLPIEKIDGVFGLRQQGFAAENQVLDTPLSSLLPPVKRYELSLTEQLAELSLGNMPRLDNMASGQLLHHHIAADEAAELQFDSLVFNDSGEVANATLLFSTMLSNQVLISTEMASSLGYQQDSGWGDIQSLNIHLSDDSGQLLSMAEGLAIEQVLVQDLKQLPASTLFLGQDFWQQLIIGMDSHEQGHLLSVGKRRDAVPSNKVLKQNPRQFIDLGFNSEADEKAPDISADGNIIVFQSNATGGLGGWDIYVYHRELGFLTLPELNSSADEQAPSINADGTLISFHSNRSGQDDVYVFHVPSRSFLDLAALNTDQPERYADLSSDGQYLALQRDLTVNVAATPSLPAYSYTDPNIILYDLASQTIVSTEAMNSQAQEMRPRLSQNGDLLVFDGADRDEIRGVLGSAHVFDRTQGQVLDSQALFGMKLEETTRHTHISPEGAYISFSSDRKAVGQKQRGQDIYLYDKNIGEFIFLPGLNSDTEDSAAALSDNAQYIVFQSQRAGGQGGYDLYLYQRPLNNPQFSTVMAYGEYGTVLGAGDVPLPFTKVNLFDGNQQLINSTHSDATGHFQVTIPEGVVTPVTYASVDGLAKIVTSEDEAARDTELPLFVPGNIKFTGIDTPANAYAGMPMTVEFELETEQIKYNTHIQIYAKNLAETEASTAAQLEIGRTNFEQISFDAQIASVLIDKLGHRQNYDRPLTLNPQDGITTQLSYQPGSDNRVLQVKHSFILPSYIEQGDYALVFTINRDDLESDDDHLQGEAFEDLDDNYRVARQTLNIGLADKPNLYILTALTTGDNSFFLPESPATEDGINPYGDIGLNLEVESMAQDVSEPVEMRFEMEIDGKRYPLAHAIPDATGEPRMTFGHRFQANNCDGSGCVSFKTRNKRGISFGFSLTETIYDYLKAKTADTFVQLVVTVDPENKIAEFQDYKVDNVRKLPLLYIAPEAANTRRADKGSDSKEEEAKPFSVDQLESQDVPDDYEKSLFNILDFKKQVGPEKVNIAFIAKGPTMTYRTDPIEFDDRIIDLPTAASFKLFGQIPVNILDKKIDVFFMGGYANVDANDLPSSSAFAGLTLLGSHVFSLTESIGEQLKEQQKAAEEDGKKEEDDEEDGGEEEEPEEEEGDGIVLISSKDDEGNERWTKEWKFPDPEKGERFEAFMMVGPIPMTLKAGIQGEVGVQGKMSIEPSNIFTAELGPSSQIEAFARVAADYGVFAVGVGVDLVLIEIGFKPKAEIQLLPGYPLALFRIQAPLDISMLSGEFYAFVRVNTLFWKDEWKVTIVGWDAPLAWVFPIIPPQAWAVGAVERYKRMSDRDMIPAVLDLKDQSPDLLSDDELADKYADGTLAKSDITIGNIQNGLIEASLFSSNDDEFEGYEDTWEGFYNLKAQEYTIKLNVDGAFCIGMDMDANGVIEEGEIDFSLFTGPNNILHEIELIEVSGSGIDGIEDITPGGLTGLLIGEGCADDEGADDDWEEAKEEWEEEWTDTTHNQVYTIKLRLGTTAARRVRVRYYNSKLDEKPRLIALWQQPEKFLATYTEGGIPKYIALDKRVDHDWNMGSPLRDVVPADNFNVVWEGSYQFEKKPYMFFAKADDDIVVTLDGETILATDRDKGRVQKLLPMQARMYDIKVEYKEKRGFANAQVDWSPYVEPAAPSAPATAPDSAPAIETNDPNPPATGAYVEYYETDEREVVLDDVGGGILDVFPSGLTTKEQRYGRYRFVFKVESRNAGAHEFYLQVGELGNYTVLVDGEIVPGLDHVSSQLPGNGRVIHIVQDMTAGWHTISIDTFKPSTHPALQITPQGENYFNWSVYPNAKNLELGSNALYTQQLAPVSEDFSDIEIDFQGKLGDSLNTVPAAALYQEQSQGSYSTAMRWDGDFEFEDAVYTFYFSSSLADNVEVLIDNVPFVSSEHTLGRHESKDGRFTNSVFTMPMSEGVHHISLTYTGKLEQAEQSALFFDWQQAEPGNYYPLLPGSSEPLSRAYIQSQTPIATRNELDPTARLYIEAPQNVAGSADLTQVLSGTWAGVFNFGRGVRFISVDYINDNTADTGECRVSLDGNQLFGKANDGWLAGSELSEVVYKYEFLFSGRHAVIIECRNVSAPTEFIIGAPKTDSYPIINRVKRSDCVQKQNASTESGNPVLADACEEARPEQKRWIFDPVTEVGGYLRDGGKYNMCLDLLDDGRIAITDCCIGGVQQKRAWLYNDDTGAIQHASDTGQCLSKRNNDETQLYLDACQTPLSAGQTWRIPNTEVYKDLVPTSIRQCEGYLELPEGSVAVPLSTADTRACTIAKQGGVRCWGGGLNDLPSTDIANVDGSIALASAESQSCAIDMENQVKCWDEDGKSSQIEALNDDIILQLVAGDKHHCTLLDTGRVKCWGDNSAAQLGHAGNDADYVLTDNNAPQEGVLAIAAAGKQSCAILSFGRVGCWGNGSRKIELIAGLGRVQQLALATDYACAILDDSSVQCWGSNAKGRLGNGTESQDNPVPTYIQSLRAGIVGLSVNDNHACALNSDGEVYCWGDNSLGQLGNKNLSHSAEPVLVTGLSPARFISSGKDYSCAMLEGDEGLYCWGDNSQGQLGAGFSAGFSALPIKVGSRPADNSPLRVSVGHQHSCLSDGQGAVLCWGNNQYGQLGTGDTKTQALPVPVKGLNNIVSLSSQGNYNCALDSQGQVHCWGNNQSGQLGDGTDINRTRPRSVDVSELLEAQQAYGLETNILQIAGSYNHTCALLSSGQVACWGANSQGELGKRAKDDPYSPALVEGLFDVQEIALGDGFSCALQSDSRVWCWGASPEGSSTSPMPLSRKADSIRADGSLLCLLSGNDNAGYQSLCFGEGAGNSSAYSQALADLRTSGSHSCGLLNSNSANNVECTGYNAEGQLGVLTPNAIGMAKVALADQALQLDVGNKHSCAVLASGQILCWGDNSEGQLGNGYITDKPTLPVVVAGRNSDAVRKQPIASGENHNCLINAEQQVYCWGNNDNGQLGDDSFEARLQATFKVQGLETPILGLNAAGNNSCAVDDKGAAFCWGANEQGQLGNGDYIDSIQAQAVLGLDSGVSLISPAGNYSCALVNAGVQCWGSNLSGVLGDPELDKSHSPVQVPGLNNGIADLATNPLQACVVVDSLTVPGAVRCWGNNNAFPQTVRGLETGVSRISAGADYFCALLQDGTVQCWGDNFALMAIELPAKALSISSGKQHSCALLEGNSVQCWGAGELGQLGNASNSTSLSPVSVQELSNNITHISSSGNHSCAYAEDNTAYCWGANNAGQLGNGSLENSNVAVPVALATLVDASDMLKNTHLTASQHSCQIDQLGALTCWGHNRFAQIGNANIQNQYSPVLASVIPEPVQAVVTGKDFSCVLDNKAQVQCWGDNSRGQLGNGASTNPLLSSPTPITVQGLEHEVISAISAGDSHACALSESGSVYCWGKDNNSASAISALPKRLIALRSHADYNCALNALGTISCWVYEGQQAGAGLGNSDVASTDNISVLSPTGLYLSLAISVGKQQSCAISDQGSVSCWDNDSQNPQAHVVAGLSHSVIGLASGAKHHCAVQKQETGGQVLSCWNTAANAPVFGQLGDGSTKSSIEPVRVTLTNSIDNPITAIAAGDNHSCIQRSNGDSYCWGQNHQGQLGDASGIDQLTPVKVGTQGNTHLKPLQNLSQIALAPHYGCAVSDAGSLKCWGYIGEDIDFSQSASWHLDLLAHNLNSDFSASRVITGANHACAISRLDEQSQSNSLYCWGYNRYGQLGDGSLLDNATAQKVALSGLRLSDVSLGKTHSCALDDKAQVYCWGHNQYGQLGLGLPMASDSQQLQPALLNTKAQQLFAADYHNCALDHQNLNCWGENTAAQLGNNSTDNQSLAGKVQGLSGVTTQLVGGMAHHCSRSQIGQVHCWGDNSYGQLGDGSNDNQTSAVALPLSLITQLSSGDDHVCALKADQSIQCWGNNRFGQLGNGNNEAQNSPTAIAQLSARQISSGKQHSCALSADGLVYCWGSNAQGQLGDGSFIDQNLPVQILGLTDIEAIEAKGDYSCALDSQGKLSCWGDNSYGQLGDGSRVASPTPIAVRGPNDPVISQGDELETQIDPDATVKLASIQLDASDVDGDSLTWALDTDPKHGAASLSPNGNQLQISYVPDPDFNGSDSFTVRVNDNNGGTDSIRIRVNIGKTGPVIDQGASLQRNLRVSTPQSPLNIDLSASSQDPDLQWQISTEAQSGQATLVNSALQATLSYTPIVGFTGKDSLIVEVTDNEGLSDQIQISIDVGENALPEINQGTQVSIDVSEGTLANTPVLTLDAADADQDPLTWRISAQGQYGQASLLDKAQGNVMRLGYVPNSPMQQSRDQLSLEVNDGNGGLAQIQVNINLVNVNDAPVITEGDATTVVMSEDADPTAFALSLHASDADAQDSLDWSISLAATHGQASLSPSATGESVSVDYQPEPNFNGRDSFIVQVSDRAGANDDITITVDVGAVDDVPVISIVSSKDLQNLYEDNDYLPLISLAATDNEPGVLTWRIVKNAQRGEVTLIPSNEGQNLAVEYRLKANQYDSDKLILEVKDQSGQATTITLDMMIYAVNDAPQIKLASQTTASTQANISVDENSTTAANTIDIALEALNFDGFGDGQSYTWAVTSPVSHGTASFNVIDSLHATLSYTPTLNYNSASDLSDNGIDDSISISVTEGSGASGSLRINFSITPVNDAPIITTAAPIVVNMNEDNSATPSTTATAFTGISSNATDVDDNDVGEILTWSINSAASNGTASVPVPIANNPSIGNFNNSVSYLPADNYNGTDSFVIAVTDSRGASKTIPVNVTIAPINDTPTMSASNASSLSASGTVAYNLPFVASDGDGDSLTWSVTSAPTKGTLTGASGTGTNKTLVYTPTLDPAITSTVSGSDSFSVQIADGNGLTASQTVNVTLTNAAPLMSASNASSLTFAEDNAQSLTLNGSDADGDTLTWSLSSAPSGGSVTGVSGTGTSKALVYTPTANIFGSDSFSVQITDGREVATQTLNLTITPVNDDPIIAQGASTTLTGAENDGDGADGSDILHSITLDASDVETSNLSWSFAAAPGKGTAGFNAALDQNSATGSSVTLYYQGDLFYVGNDSLTVRVEDADGGIANIVVNVTTTSTNTPPVFVKPAAGINAFAVDGNNPAPLDIELEALDSNGDTMRWSVINPPAVPKGTLTGIVNGDVGTVKTLTYTPNDYSSSYTEDFTIEIDDERTSGKVTLSLSLGVGFPPVIKDKNGVEITSFNDVKIYRHLSGNQLILDGIYADDADMGDLTWRLTSLNKYGEVYYDGSSVTAQATHATNPDDLIDTLAAGSASPVSIYYRLPSNLVGKQGYIGDEAFEITVTDESGLSDTVSFNPQIGWYMPYFEEVQIYNPTYGYYRHNHLYYDYLVNYSAPATYPEIPSNHNISVDESYGDIINNTTSFNVANQGLQNLGGAVNVKVKNRLMFSYLQPQVDGDLGDVGYYGQIKLIFNDDFNRTLGTPSWPANPINKWGGTGDSFDITDLEAPVNSSTIPWPDKLEYNYSNYPFIGMTDGNRSFELEFFLDCDKYWTLYSGRAITPTKVAADSRHFNTGGIGYDDYTNSEMISSIHESHREANRCIGDSLSILLDDAIVLNINLEITPSRLDPVYIHPTNVVFGPGQDVPPTLYVSGFPIEIDTGNGETPEDYYPNNLPSPPF